MPSQSLPTSMTAWQYSPTLFSAGPFDRTLTLNQVAPVPALKPNQTLVKVLTAGLNPIDYKVGELAVVTRLAIGSPSTPGLDYVGRVWATTLPADAGIKAGDLVFGKLEGAGAPTGTLAAFTVVSGPEGVVKVPKGDVELDSYAGLGVAGLTAYQSIVPALENQGPGSARGKSVFINGGSGGVGTFAVQIAKAIGCENIVVSCSGANAELVKGLGATEVVDYRSVNVVDGVKSWVTKQNGGRKFDHVVDNAGADMGLYWNAHEYLKDGAKYMFVGAGISIASFYGLAKCMMWPTFLGGGQRGFEFLALATKKADYERLAGWMVEGKVKVVIDSTFEDPKEAYAKLKTGRARGNIVVRMSEDGRGDN